MLLFLCEEALSDSGNAARHARQTAATYIPMAFSPEREAMRHILWTLKLLSAPQVPRHCKTCGAERMFRSSGQFRVNANHHLLDVWLIHRCEMCGRTWNMEVAERVRPRDLPPVLLDGYQQNDPALALHCAHDSALLRKNRVKAVYNGVPFAVEGPVPAMDALDGPAVVRIDCEHAPDLRLAQVLRSKLGISSTAFRALAEAGRVRCPAAEARRARFVPGMEVILLPAMPDRECKEGIK